MKILTTLFILLLIASPAAAYLSELYVPETGTTGTPVTVWIMGGLPDSCWYFEGLDVSWAEAMVTLEITLIYDNPTGDMCLGVVEPYDLYEDVEFLSPGLWTVRVLEHSVRPGINTTDTTWDRLIEVTGPTPVEPVTWDRLKAAYR